MYGIQPITPDAVAWLVANVQAEAWQWLGDILWLDSAEVAEPIAEAMLDEGLERGADVEFLRD